MFQSVGEIFSQYFDQNKVLLEDNYPGIKLRYLIDQFYRFSGVEYQDNFLIDFNLQEQIENFFLQLEEGKPFQYISGIAHFYGRDFIVNSNVLIPRQETEILADEVINLIKKNKLENLRILDLATGSGCIGLTIFAEVGTKIKELILSDISKSALEVASINLEKLKYEFTSNGRIELVQSDLFQNIRGKFNLIVSNPPYIKRKKNLKDVHPQVLKYEPDVALFVDDEKYTEFFQQLFLETRQFLLVNGIFFMEGHEDSLDELEKLWNSNFPSDKTKILLDLTNRKRFLLVKKDGE